MISTEGISYQVPNGPCISYPNLQLDAGEALLVLGKSGSGKTTLLHILAGILQASHGKVTINGKMLHTGTHRERQQFLGQQIGMVYQKSHFVESLSVQQNICLAPFFANKKLDNVFFTSIVDNLGIGQLLHKKTYQISTGEAQRVSIARALINKPSLLLADEPTSALDDENCTAVMQLLLAQAHLANATVITVTHDARLKLLFHQHLQLAPLLP